MKSTLVLLSLLFITPAFAAKTSPCTLDSSVLAPWRNANATDEQWAASRRALFDFMSCDPAGVDAQSRRNFYEVVDREFNTDHTARIQRWAAAHASANPDGAWEAVNNLQYALRNYLHRIFDPARDGKEFKHIVLHYGKAQTLAALGPKAQREVLDILGAPDRFYGVSKSLNPKVDALGALAYWIDPANPSFTPAEKYDFAQILTGLLELSESVHNGHHRRLVETALTSLAKSDDSHALAAVEKWAGKRADRTDRLSEIASKTVAEMRKNVKKKQ
jgi:hypothetical protein